VPHVWFRFGLKVKDSLPLDDLDHRAMQMTEQIKVGATIARMMGGFLALKRANQRPSSRIIAAPFSAIIAVGVLVLPEVIVGITEASTTRNPPMP
jgi:hypothetical protein